MSRCSARSETDYAYREGHSAKTSVDDGYPKEYRAALNWTPRTAFRPLDHRASQMLSM